MLKMLILLRMSNISCNFVTPKDGEPSVSVVTKKHPMRHARGESLLIMNKAEQMSHSAKCRVISSFVGFPSMNPLSR